MKNPPPSTPTPRRFLVAKRAAQPATSTPEPQSQFQSMPQFSSTYVPRPKQWRDAGVEDVDDESDEIPANEDFAGRAGMGTQDSIDIDSDALSVSHEFGVSSKDYHSDLMLESDAEADSLDADYAPNTRLVSEGRQAKRRRLSISPADESSPLALCDARFEAASRWDKDDLDDAPDSADNDSDEGIEATAVSTGLANQPVFQPPPRFKLADSGLAGEDGDPRAVASPQHSGGQYLPGGLAAGLQSWLSELRCRESPNGTGGSTLHIVVNQVRRSRRMCLVQSCAGNGEQTRRFILAGQGRPTGLDKHAAVVDGSAVHIGLPRWDVDLDGETWTVACDWAVS